MTDIMPSSALISQLPIENFTNYLQSNGWKIVTDTDRLRVFEGYADIQGRPLKLVFPKSADAPDTPIYLAKAINLLSALIEDEPANIIQAIEYYDRDILRIKNMETGENQSIPLALAAAQVSNLKQLVSYSACSEKEPRPYFNSTLKSAKLMTEHFRFGHTFNGSFGYSIESRLLSTPTKLTQLRLQAEDFQDDVSELARPPIERRVMERILRGFITTKDAVVARNWHLLVDEYGLGFNANMCQAVISMARSDQTQLECSVIWSRKLPPSQDIAKPPPVRLNSTAYEYLAEAVDELRKLQPEVVEVKGLIIGFASENNPLDGDTEREVVIRSIMQRRTYKIRVILNREEYIQASDAHFRWSTVSVTGTLLRTGTGWQLADSFGFRVLN